MWDQVRTSNKSSFETVEDDFALDSTAKTDVANSAFAWSGGQAAAGAHVNRSEQFLIVDAPAVGESLKETPARISNSSAVPSRVIDILAAGAMLLLFLPLMAVIYLALKLLEPGPATFTHRRIGQNGQSFGCLKFRTMAVDADQRLARILAQDDELLREWTTTQKLLCDPRVTRLGRFLRNTSLDELPQLINVLRGEMSLVGPRPVIADELRRYGRFAEYYCTVKPGLTGLWQVTRTEQTTYRRRVATDVYYVRNKSLLNDCRIIAATIPTILAGNS